MGYDDDREKNTDILGCNKQGILINQKNNHKPNFKQIITLHVSPWLYIKNNMKIQS